MTPLQGNNLYGEDVRKTLEELAGKKEREQFILMDLLQSPIQDSKIFAMGTITQAQIVPEFGIFGAYLQ